LQLKTKNVLQLDIKEFETKRADTKVILEVDNIKPKFRNVKFWYKRKSFPKIEDEGVCDIDLSAGEGTKLRIIWKIKSRANKPYTFSLMKVQCTISHMDIKIKEARHDILDKIASSLFIGTIKQSLAQSIVNNLVESLQPLNDAMNQWFSSRPLTSVVERANESLQSAVVQTQQYIQEKPITERISEATEQLKEKLTFAKEDVQAKTEGAMERGKIQLEQGKEEVKQKFEKGKEKVQEVVEKGKETAREEPKEGAWHYQWSKKRRGKKQPKPYIPNEKEFPPLVSTVQL
jgi:hypothetical protein